MNMKLLLWFAENNHEIFFKDSADGNDENRFEMSTKNLQQLKTANIFSSKLHLKLEVLIMLLQNIDQLGKLNNRLQLILTRID